MKTRFKMSSLALVLTLSAPIAVANSANGISANVAADLLYQLEMLQQEVSQLRGQVEQQNYELSKLKSLSKERYIDLDKRLSTLSTQAAPAMLNNSTQTAVASNNPVSGQQAGGGSNSSVKSLAAAPVKLEEPSADAKAAYNSAYALVRERNFEGAQTSLRAFAEKYPNNTLTGNAHYWLGELALVLGNQGEALVQFKIVQDSFSGHSKVPDAIYKLGIVNDQLGNKTLVKDSLNRVITNFPDSNAAALAANYLNDMK